MSLLYGKGKDDLDHWTGTTLTHWRADAVDTGHVFLYVVAAHAAREKRTIFLFFFRLRQKRDHDRRAILLGAVFFFFLAATRTNHGALGSYFLLRDIPSTFGSLVDGRFSVLGFGAEKKKKSPKKEGK